ncbi:BDNF/NT-3 growth factors receptor-like [Tachypleus tridentatus]|uniref:BDNF/NT-3 growth factors receptor-like n=1 Tax=Tachypleus tridentatus TaxID=6853 RepID=UPI003FD2703B
MCCEYAQTASGSIPVAVKVLKDNLSTEILSDFEREVKAMATFDHENILRLLGVVLKEAGSVPCMVFEYMQYGDLGELLRNNDVYIRLPSNQICSSLTQVDLVLIAIQIARGMTYLSSQHFVHRDLATRNCLVGENLKVKISDFGMSRDIYTCDYYKIGGSRMLPVRWMAPESIVYGKFTLYSDVWSYGVVLWEIFTFGKQPYYGHSNEEVVKLILQGILLSPPGKCPYFIYNIMAGCWKTEPRDRLKFPDIYHILIENAPTRTNATSVKTPSQHPALLNHEVEEQHPAYINHEVEEQHPGYLNHEVEEQHPAYINHEVEEQHPAYLNHEVEEQHPAYLNHEVGEDLTNLVDNHRSGLQQISRNSSVGSLQDVQVYENRNSTEPAASCIIGSTQDTYQPIFSIILDATKEV